MLGLGRTNTKGLVQQCCPGPGLVDYVFFASDRWGVSISTTSSGQAAVDLGSRALDFGLHEGDSCGDFADPSILLIFF